MQITFLSLGTKLTSLCDQEPPGTQLILQTVIKKENFRNHSYHSAVKKAVWGNPSYSSPDFPAQFFPKAKVSHYPVQFVLAQLCCHLYEVVLVQESYVKRHEFALLVERRAIFGTPRKNVEVEQVKKDIYTIIYHFEHDIMMPYCI